MLISKNKILDRETYHLCWAVTYSLSNKWAKNIVIGQFLSNSCKFVKDEVACFSSETMYGCSGNNFIY